MSRAERAALAALHRLPPERAHAASLAALRAGLGPRRGPVTTPRLATTLAGLSLANPLGLAAGYDKNAVALAALGRAGFGFIEAGAATPRPQPGNPRPRVFRLSADGAVINRAGFNNDGAAAVAARLARRPAGLPVGLNLGANKDSADFAGDLAAVLATAGAHVDFATVNVSSPNTAGLRALQENGALGAVLARVGEANAALARPVPVFLKIAPDLDPEALAAVAETATASGADAIVATNTTLARDGLTDPARGEAGGLSGAPLFERSTRVLARLSRLTGGRLALVGVGGIASAEDAYAKIGAGAAALQLYTGLVYHGLARVAAVLDGLERRLARDGFESVAAARGRDRDRWL